MTWRDRPIINGVRIPYVAVLPDEEGYPARETEGALPDVEVVWGRSPFSGDEGYVLRGAGLYRDPLGWLWTTAPRFGGMHVARYRECIDRLLCQVCGEPAADAAGHTTWVDMPPVAGVFDRLGHRREPEYATKRWIRTATPPVCEECIPVALKECPHLRKRALRTVRVPPGAVEPYGVIGAVFGKSGEIECDEALVTATARGDAAARTLAEHRVVTIRAWVGVRLSP